MASFGPVLPYWRAAGTTCPPKHTGCNRLTGAAATLRPHLPPICRKHRLATVDARPAGSGDHLRLSRRLGRQIPRQRLIWHANGYHRFCGCNATNRAVAGMLALAGHGQVPRFFGVQQDNSTVSGKMKWIGTPAFWQLLQSLMFVGFLATQFVTKSFISISVIVDVIIPAPPQSDAWIPDKIPRVNLPKPSQGLQGSIISGPQKHWSAV